eukprot:CAMPEP_0115036664 /NCGR_PEP_ID=MMETSP0216-20121206/42261_1 /TAXON_ID=223996 /ORGANISM="Protocruzia adherens, Strain Boccale" /LENGTH=540 /DNA_ID=CAMNT_0002416543 /DNA_START=89 /DNA_END=1711 /DNA_ORIENTATION=+
MATAQQMQQGNSRMRERGHKEGFQVSQQTRERVEACKGFIEKKYAKLKFEEQERKQGWEELQRKMESLNLSQVEQDMIKQDIMHKEAERMREGRRRMTAREFQPLAIIGRGAFGEVRLCRHRDSSEVVAVKKMKKTEMVYKNQVAHVRAERDVLATSDTNWIVDLKYSFQDEKHLYLVMEFLPGGDLMTLLMRKDILSEEESRFYIAETILAVEEVHRMDYIHRDLKPDNILLDKNGHVKLSDFGLCKHAEINKHAFKTFAGYRKIDEEGHLRLKGLNAFQRRRQLANSTVGTPDYIAPEVFGQQGYDETVDWWSVGVILFEMLVGYPPFFSDDPSLTCQKILHWKKTLVIPPEAKLSPAAMDLLKRLICDAENRLGSGGVDEIKNHAFFRVLDWKAVRGAKAPYIPDHDLKGDSDTQNFDNFEEEEPWIDEEPRSSRNKMKNRKQDLNFIGFTYKKDSENQRPALVEALEGLEQIRMTHDNTYQNPGRMMNDRHHQMMMESGMGRGQEERYTEEEPSSHYRMAMEFATKTNARLGKMTK